MKTQSGTSCTADFEEHTWTFEMDIPFSVCAGRFAIVDLDTHVITISILKQLRNYFGEHDKTMDEHRFYSIIDNAIKANET